MKKLFALVLLLLLVACQTPPLEVATATPAATNTPEPPTETPTATIEPSPTVDPVAACKLRRIGADLGLGFPTNPIRLPSTGTVRAAVLFLDFDDAPSASNPEDLFALFSPGAEQFYTDVSSGNMNLVLEPHFAWLRASEHSSHYVDLINQYGYAYFGRLLEETVGLADDLVDFSGVNLIIVVTSPEATLFTNSMAFLEDERGTNSFEADGTLFHNGLLLASDLPYWGYIVLNHEVGHNMGLDDLYSVQAVAEERADFFPFTSEFSVMGDAGGIAPEFFAYESWNLGWLSDDQIVCQQEQELTTTITALETPGGVKAVVVPLNLTRNKALVIESRRAMRYDEHIVKPGALVYVVDTKLVGGDGQIMIHPQGSGVYTPLALGESVTVEGITVTVVDAGDDYDTVTVTKP